MATDRISVRVDAETIKYLEQIGGEGRGAISRGVGAVIEFAQMTPRAFQAFLNGREFADIGEIITVREGDYLCAACSGSGHYDADGAPPCEACKGTGEQCET